MEIVERISVQVGVWVSANKSSIQTGEIVKYKPQNNEMPCLYTVSSSPPPSPSSLPSSSSSLVASIDLKQNKPSQDG